MFYCPYTGITQFSWSYLTFDLEDIYSNEQAISANRLELSPNFCNNDHYAT